MKISYRDITRQFLQGSVVKEESGPQKRNARQSSLLNEQFGMGVEALHPLAAFGQAWASLGSAVQEQVVAVINAYIQNDDDRVYGINPNALDLATQRLSRSLNDLGQTNPDAEEIMEALEWAGEILGEEEE